jgi:hypothetical protein
MAINLLFLPSHDFISELVIFSADCNSFTLASSFSRLLQGLVIQVVSLLKFSSSREFLRDL